MPSASALMQASRQAVHFTPNLPLKGTAIVCRRSDAQGRHLATSGPHTSPLQALSLPLLIFTVLILNTIHATLESMIRSPSRSSTI